MGESFLIKSRKVHGDKYDYSLVEYINSYTKIKIICKKHGIFKQTPSAHIQGHGCSLCSNNNIKYTTKIFIEKSKEIHGDKYDYSLVEYKNNKIKVKIICKKHGIFEQNLKSHITNKYGCPKCGGVKKLTNNEFINKSKEIHGDKYDYSLVKYKNNSTKVEIICKVHGIFEQKPNKHMSGNGCQKCYGNNTKTTNQFILDSKKIHGDKYDYSLVDYKNNRTKVKIICKEHDVFEQSPDSHLRGHGCPKCKKQYKPNEQDLYILYDEKYNIFKIGVSINVKRRCRELNSRYYNGNKTIKIKHISEKKGEFEKIIFNKLKENRIKHPTYNNTKSDGRTEWFNIDNQLLNNEIKKILE